MRTLALSIIAVLSLAVAPASAAADHNRPWFPSLMSFEHYDSGRTHLFEQARFGGSYSRRNEVAVRTAPVTYPSGYNMVYLNPREVFLYGGGYGNVDNATGAFVAKVDPDTLEPIWYTQLIDTQQNGEWNYPGVLSILNDGHLYVIFGYRLAKLDRDGRLIKQVELPTGEGLPEDTSYNGFDALPDGTLIAKTLYRSQGCPVQGPPALFQCPLLGYPTPPPSMMITIDPRTLDVVDQVTLPAPVGGRPTTARFHGKDYVYLVSPQTAFRYEIKKGRFTTHDDPDPSWQPGNIYKSGQSLGSAVVIMHDWFVVQTNGSSVQSNLEPTQAPLSVIAISQAAGPDGVPTRQFSAQPFANVPVPSYISEACGGCTSWAPMSVSVDPTHNLIYTADSAPGAIAALELTSEGLRTVWTVLQRTTEFLTLIGPRSRRVIVGTDIPPGQVPLGNDNDFVVWRDAQTGEELARTHALPAMTSGTMIQPYYFGKMFYMGLDPGNLIELTVQPAPAKRR